MSSKSSNNSNNNKNNNGVRVRENIKSSSDCTVLKHSAVSNPVPSKDGKKNK